MIFLILIILILNPIFQETFTNQPSYEQINDYIKEIEIPTKNSGLAGLTIDEDNNVWFVEINANKIGVLFTNNFTIKEFPFKIDRTAKPGIEFVALSQIKYDKIRRSLWFTWSPSDSIGKFDLNSLSFEFYSIDEKDSGVFDLLIDDEGNIWVTLLYGKKIVKFYPDIKKFEKYLIPDPTGGPAILTMDNYKNIWGTLNFGRKIFKLNLEKLKPNTSEGVEIFDNFSYKNVFISPLGIAYDHKRNLLWIADHGSSAIYSFNPFNLTWKQYLVYQPFPYALINHVKVDSEGKVWFASHFGNTVGYLNPEERSVVEFIIPTSNSTTLWLEIDKNDNVYFTEFDGNKIGFINNTSKIKVEIDVYKKYINSGEVAEFEINVNFLNIDGINVTLDYSSIYFFLKDKLEINTNLGKQFLLKNNTSLKIKIKYNDVPQGEYTFLISFKSQKIIISFNVYLSVGPKPFEWLNITLAITIPLIITILIFIFLRKIFYKK